MTMGGSELEEPPDPDSTAPKESLINRGGDTDMQANDECNSGSPEQPDQCIVKKCFERSIKYLLYKFSPDFVSLFETHVAGTKADAICRMMNFDNFERVERKIRVAVFGCYGIRRPATNLSMLLLERVLIWSMSWSSILVLMSKEGSGCVSRCQLNWMAFFSPVSKGGGGLMLFKVLMSGNGGSSILLADSIYFGDWIHRNNLIDLGFQGSPFTWARGSEAVGLIQKRLDRVLVVVHRLTKLCSNHNPLLIQFNGRPTGDPRRPPFRFQAAWISHPRSNDFLKEKWNSRDDLPVALESLKQELRSWNKKVFGDVHERKNSLMQQLDKVQQQLARAPNNAALLLNKKIQEELDLILEQEEMVWFQKSQQHCGDKNTKFFHMSTVMRRRSNWILTLKVNVDRWCMDPVILENHALYSSTWRGIAEGFNQVITKGRKWNVVSGTLTKFWTDSWLKDSKLADFYLTIVPNAEKDAFVSDYRNIEEGWDQDRLSTWLSKEILLRLASVGLTEPWEGNDTVSWSPSPSRKFSSGLAHSIM
ncbi:LOW QUALITY PROTEIN: hypothetical protein V2J09_023028 [Rumex salicifolius]